MNNFTEKKLNKGVIHLYDFGAVKLHAYQTNDFLADEVFIFEKNGKAVMLEAPAFYENNEETKTYLESLGLELEGILLAYHMAGGTLYPEAKKYATKNAEDFALNGGGKALMDNFSSIWTDAFDREVHKITDYLEEGTTEIGGIRFIITKTSDAFDVEIPEINVVYTHMLGHDCHSIVAGEGHADAIIAQLKGYLAKNYQLVLSSHYTPEELKDVETKLAYLDELKNLAKVSSSASEFKEKVQENFPTYSGDNYLDMTSHFFFQK